MIVDIPQSDMAMALLNGRPDDYNSLISALDVVENEDSQLKWEFVKSRITGYYRREWSVWHKRFNTLLQRNSVVKPKYFLDCIFC